MQLFHLFQITQRIFPFKLWKMGWITWSETIDLGMDRLQTPITKRSKAYVVWKVALTWLNLDSWWTKISLTSLQNSAFVLSRVSMVEQKNGGEDNGGMCVCSDTTLLWLILTMGRKQRVMKKRMKISSYISSIWTHQVSYLKYPTTGT